MSFLEDVLKMNLWEKPVTVGTGCKKWKSKRIL
jgi:hypothetical protein